MGIPVLNKDTFYLPEALRLLNFQSGTATLASGTVTVTGVTINTSSSVIMLAANTPAGTGGTRYKAPAASRTATQFVITAVDTAGATVATDTSTIDWMILG